MIILVFLSIEKYCQWIWFIYRNEYHPFLTWKFLRQIGFDAARTHRYLTPPQCDANVHWMCAGPDSRERGKPRAVHICCLLVPDSGECGCGPDQPTEQRLGVGTHFVIYFRTCYAFCKFMSKMEEALSSTKDHILLKASRKSLSYFIVLGFTTWAKTWRFFNLSVAFSL